MLEQLNVRNFQIHRKLVIDFGPNVTVIIGPTGAGKSAAIRAIKWAAANRPAGVFFVRRGAAKSTARLSVDGRRIIRKRGKGVNTYRLGSTTYQALGASGVPDEVARLLDVSDTNFQSQHDPYFWFSLTPGEVAKQINQIVNLQKIDQSLAKINSQLRTSRGEVVFCEQRLTESQRKLKELSWVDHCRRDLEALSSVQDDIKSETHRIASALSIVEEVQALTERQQRLSDAKADALALDTAAQDYFTAKGEVRQLDALLYAVTQAEDELRSLREDLQELRNEIRDRTGGVCPVCKQPMPD